MTTPQTYFLILVIAAFLAFAIGLGANYISYRRWLQNQPARVRDFGRAEGLHAADD